MGFKTHRYFFGSKIIKPSDQVPRNNLCDDRASDLLSKLHADEAEQPNNLHDMHRYPLPVSTLQQPKRGVVKGLEA